MSIMGIDPGHTQSAWIILDEYGVPVDHGIWPNEHLLNWLREVGDRPQRFSTVVIEQIASYGMAVGAEVFETVYWSGQFAEAARPARVERLKRMQIKMHLCGHPRAKDMNIRQALIDLYGGPSSKGTKLAPGPLYGVSKDVWSALAVARTWYDQQQA